MKNIEKALKRQAENVLPSADVNAKIMSRMPSNTEQKEETPKVRRAPRRYVYSMIAAMLVVCIGLGFGLGFGLGGKDKSAPIVPSDTYVALSINPSFGITATADGVVTEVTALNEDAVIVLYGVDLTGMTIEDAADKIVELSASLGYLKEGGKADFTVCNSDSAIISKVESAINAKINENEVLSSLNVSLNFNFGGIDALENKARELLAGVDLSGLDADAINKLINDFDEEKLRKYAEEINMQYNDVLKKVVETAQGLIDVISKYDFSLALDVKYKIEFYNAVQEASECVGMFLNYIGVEDTSDAVSALLDVITSTDGLEKATNFLLDLCDGDGEFDFDIELLLKAELKAKKTN